MLPDRVPLCETYRGRWREILIGLGVPDKMLVNRHGPCPACGGKDRFRFDDRDGHGTYFCSHCGAGDGPKLAMLVTGMDFREVADRIRRAAGGEIIANGRLPGRASVVEREETSDQKRRRMNQLWGRALPVKAADPAGIYLASRLGRMPTGTGLRFQPECRYPGGEAWGAMLAVFIGPDGVPSGLHRTYLTADGRKAPLVSPRLSLGPLVNGGAVRLAPSAPVLGIAEGIETALAASRLFDVPCWAALNAGRLAAWEPPAGVDEIVIFADNDENFTGQLAAFDLEARMKANISVRIETPIDEGTDWNDVLRTRQG